MANSDCSTIITLPLPGLFQARYITTCEESTEFLLLVIMETDESIDLQVHVGFNDYGSRIYAGSEEEEEIVEDEEVRDRSVKPHATICMLLQMICNCKGACARKKGQGFCLCKAANKNCLTRCRCPHSKCKNNVSANDRSQLLIISFIP